MKPEPSEYVAKVRPVTGEECTFEVQSKSAPGGNAEHAGWYKVDVAAHRGSGECQCIRWSTVSWPFIRDTGKLPPRFRCRHLKAAREFCLNKMIEHFNKEHPSE